MLKHVIVSGIVQGVGFRFNTKQAAEDLGIKGWVRNNTDSTVEMEIEGDEETLNQFVDKLRSGLTPAARVDNVDVSTHETRNNYKDFTIK